MRGAESKARRAKLGEQSAESRARRVKRGEKSAESGMQGEMLFVIIRQMFQGMITPKFFNSYTMDNERIHEMKKCPRCGKAFICSASPRCWCYEYDIPVDQLEFIEREYDSCLCPDCLKEYARSAD